MIARPHRPQRRLVEPQVPGLRHAGRRGAAARLEGSLRRAGGSGALHRQGHRRGNPRRDDLELRRPARARGGADAPRLVVARSIRRDASSPPSGTGSFMAARPSPVRCSSTTPSSRRSRRWCRSRPCISPTTWSRSGSSAAACRGCRRSPASTPPSTRPSPTSRACSRCRARCASAACGATASTACPMTTSRPC